jgi:peptide deformylase
MQLVDKNSPSLKTICDAVPLGAPVAELVKEMFELMRKSQGVGLAAPQVGHLWRLVVIEYGAVSCAIINPVITKWPGKIVTSIGEGCLSFPGKKVDVKRHKRVVVEGFDVDWSPLRIDARGHMAFIVQHELDHLDGVTIV